MQDFEAWLYGGAVSCIAMILNSNYEVSPASILRVLSACVRTNELLLCMEVKQESPRTR